MTGKRAKILLLTLLVFCSAFTGNGTRASPPWLTVGFYARYFIYSAHFIYLDFSTPYNYKTTRYVINASGTLIWKVEEVKNNRALIEVNVNAEGVTLPNRTKEAISESFHLLVDTGDRFILNTTESDPLYFPYWIPIGTKILEETVVGHFFLRNIWLYGKFYGYGELQYVNTSWKTLRSDDLILLDTTVRGSLTDFGLVPDFGAIYDKASGILVGIDIGCEPLLIKFLNIFVFLTPIAGKHFGILLDNIGIEPSQPSEGDLNEVNGTQTPPRISISSLIIPFQIEAGDEFQLNVTILNNSTAELKNVEAVLSCSNESIKFLSPTKTVIESIGQHETKEITWRCLLQSEGTYSLGLAFSKDSNVILQKNLLVECEPSLLQKAIPYAAVSASAVLILVAFFTIRKGKVAERR